MKIQQTRLDVSIQKTAQARMRKIVRELVSADEERKAALRSEYEALDGSWNIVEEVDIPGVITEEEAGLVDIEAGKEARRQAIRDELAANDARALRSIFEGDQARLAEHNKRQEALRVQLRAI